VIVDLEDGVAAAAKSEARANLPGLLSGPQEKPVFVRVADVSDLDLVATLQIEGVILPKVERAADVPDTPVLALIESALGVENAFEIASHPSVRGISLGESDLRSQTGALDVDWARSRIVNAALAAGLPRPPQSVYPHVRDLDGLARSCRRGRELGHLGRSAIHPGQLPVIEQAYLPTDDEVAQARATIARLEDGVGTLDGGAFVDAAMLGAAQQVVDVAERYGIA
jgi:citrate lyase subunit beta/citryl-CoA lyase